MDKQPIRTRLIDLAGQENHDGPEYDLMMEAAEYIQYLENRLGWAQEAVNQLQWRVDSARDGFN